jgi:uncharacterized phage infection (PIP) family protein YhgE
LNPEKLNALKTALDDLQIVDVERKPAGLSQDLRASDEFVKNIDAVKSLAGRGFYPTKSRSGQGIDILSSEGEATCTTKDGVRYVLRFGGLAGGDEVKDDKADDKANKNPALNRFLFVMAQFDENQIAKPKLEPLPGADQPAEDKPADEKKADDGDKPADAKDEAAVKETKTADEESPAAPATQPAAAEGDTAKSEPGETKKDEAPPTPEEEQRIAVQKENKRKQEEYDNAIKKGQDRVKELNDRFADWYFIISDDVYKKIHLGRGDIVKKKADKDSKDGIPSGLNELKDLEKGLKPE